MTHLAVGFGLVELTLEGRRCFDLAVAEEFSREGINSLEGYCGGGTCRLGTARQEEVEGCG
jgi:hypothetical protein